LKRSRNDSITQWSEGKKTALLQPDFFIGFANVLFCAGAVDLKYHTKHQLPLRAKAGGENKSYQVRSVLS